MPVFCSRIIFLAGAFTGGGGKMAAAIANVSEQNIQDFQTTLR